MTEIKTITRASGKLPLSCDPLDLADMVHNRPVLAPKHKGQERSAGCVTVRYRNGRPYYYERYYMTENGKRRQVDHYLGTELPKGYRLRRVKRW